MKILTLWQPHASAIALGLKRIETRGKRTSHRGLTAIHAAKKWDGEIIDIIGSLPAETRRLLPPLRAFPLGAIVAVGDLVDCYPTLPGFTSAFEQYPELDTPLERSLGNYGEGRYGWIFENVRPLLEPLVYPGSRCMLDVPEKVVKEVLRRVAQPCPTCKGDGEIGQNHPEDGPPIGCPHCGGSGRQGVTRRV